MALVVHYRAAKQLGELKRATSTIKDENCAMTKLRPFEIYRTSSYV